ncbi:MAG: DUF1840 domain-containing protein [Burkholderiales bacterium]
MLVTFHSKAWSSITLFGDVAVTLLKMMGHSGTVPSALLAADVPSALTHLQQALDAANLQTQQRNAGANVGDADAPVALRARAYPLIQLLSEAAKQKCDVMWDDGYSVL